LYLIAEIDVFFPINNMHEICPHCNRRAKLVFT